MQSIRVQKVARMQVESLLRSLEDHFRSVILGLGCVFRIIDNIRSR